jgi:phytoene dehydrogenase-like protein
VDVIVVGAGLAGLRCALLLERAGLEVTVLEGSDRVGGRVATDVVDGFLVDRGFQVLNPAYPALGGSVDVDALDLRAYDAGVLVRTDDGLRVLAHPVRAPRDLVRTVGSGLLGVRDVAGLARWLAPVLAAPQLSLRGRDRAWGAALDDLHVTGDLRTVLDRFLAGVLVETEGATSARLVRLLLRSFVLGSPGVPRDGMRALPALLAAPLRDVRLNTAVESLQPDRSHPAVVAGGARLTARAVVVATDPGGAQSLAHLPPIATRGLVTWWFAADEPPTRSRKLAIDARGGSAPPGPVWNTGVATNVAASYAPPGRHLVHATTLLDRPDGEAPEHDVRRHLAGIYGCDTARWQVVARHRIEHALPATPPGSPVRRAVALGDGLFVCGDHRDTASLQGALVSGRRAAAAVRRALAVAAS